MKAKHNYFGSILAKLLLMAENASKGSMNAQSVFRGTRLKAKSMIDPIEVNFSDAELATLQAIDELLPLSSLPQKSSSIPENQATEDLENPEIKRTKTLITQLERQCLEIKEAIERGESVSDNSFALSKIEANIEAHKSVLAKLSNPKAVEATTYLVIEKKNSPSPAAYNDNEVAEEEAVTESGEDEAPAKEEEKEEQKIDFSLLFTSSISEFAEQDVISKESAEAAAAEFALAVVDENGGSEEIIEFINLTVKSNHQLDKTAPSEEVKTTLTALWVEFWVEFFNRSHATVNNEEQSSEQANTTTETILPEPQQTTKKRTNKAKTVTIAPTAQ